jgi:hypothetical protein
MIAAMTIQLALVISATCCAGFLMIVGGLQKRMLERPGFGVCPTCGRRLQHRACGACRHRGR